VAGLCALGLLLTETRSVWIAAGAGSLVALLAARETRRYVVPAFAAAGLLVVIALAVIPGLSASVHKRTSDQQPVWDRKNSNAAALRMIKAKPVLGFGWARFASDSGDYYRQSQDYPLSSVRNVHNVYLANAVELGLLGALLWLAACSIAIGGAVLRRGPPSLHPWKIGLIAIAVSYAVVGMTTPEGYALSAMLLWTWAGVAWGEQRRPALSRLRWWPASRFRCRC
jgi:putative inorganic carbon (hco3(-)) transporter